MDLFEADEWEFGTLRVAKICGLKIIKLHLLVSSLLCGFSLLVCLQWHFLSFGDTIFVIRDNFQGRPKSLRHFVYFS